MVIFATLFQHCQTLWKSTLKMTTLFRRCLTLFNSTMKYTTLFQCCWTLRISTLRYITLFQPWFEVVWPRDVISTLKQRWTDIEMFAGIYVKNCYSVHSRLFIIARKRNWILWRNSSRRSYCNDCICHRNYSDDTYDCRHY